MSYSGTSSVARIGIRPLLLALVAVALLPAFLLVLQNYRQVRLDAQEGLKVELQTVAVLAQSGQENVVAGVRNILETVASGPSVRRTDIRPLCFEFLANIVSRSSDYANLGYADPQGDVQCIARGTGQPLNVADREYFQVTSQTRRFAIGGYITGKVLAVPALAFSIPVYDYSDKYVGVAFASLSLQRMNSVLQKLMLRKGLRVDLADAEGVLLGSTSGSFGQIGATYPVELIRGAIVEAARAQQEVVTLDHEGSLFQVRAVESDAGRSMYVVASADVEQTFSGLEDRLLRQLLALLALLAAGLILAWQIGVVLVAKPVLALRRSMVEASVKPHTLPAGYAHRTRELQDLDVGLHGMVEKLREGQLQIERAQSIAGIGFYTLDEQAGVYRIDDTIRGLLALEQGQEITRARFEAAFRNDDLQDLRALRAQVRRNGGEVRLVVRSLGPSYQQRVLELFELLPGEHDQQGMVLSGAIQDVTERHRMQRMYAVLGNVNEVVIFSKTRIELFTQLCRVAFEVGEFQMTWVAGFDPIEQTLTSLAVAGKNDGYLDLATSRKCDLGEGDLPAARAFRTGDIVVVDDVSLLEETTWWRSEAMQRGYRSIAALPLKLDGETVAVVIFMASSPHHFQSDERKLLSALAASLSNALSHQRVLVERERVLKELTATSDRLMRAQSLARLGNWTRYAADKSAIWSPGLYELLGRDPSLGPPMISDARRNVHPEDVAAYLSTMESALAGNTRIRQIRYRCQREDGQWRWFEEVLDDPVRDSSGFVTQVSGTVQDITEQMESERTLQLQLSRTELLNEIARATEARHDLKSVMGVVCEKLESHFNVAASAMLRRVEGSDSFIVEQLGEHGQRIAGSTGLQEGVMLDASSHGLMRCLSAELIYEPDLSIQTAALPRSLVEAGLHALVSVPLQSSGETFGVIVVARHAANSFSSGECEFLRQLSEHVSLSATHARLIESLKKAYSELEDAQQSAMQQERLRLLGQMASGIAHDINNAISPISLYADSLLYREKHLSEVGRKQLETIQLAVSDVTDTIARLRDFYRPGSEVAQLRTIQPNRLVLQALELTKARWRDQKQLTGGVIDVVTQFVEPCPDILLSEAEVRDAVVNLILNAVDAMPNGGKLTIATRLLVDSEMDRYEIEICDSGIGMDEETLRRCIEPFFTTKGDQGSGLGLAMVFGCMKRHNGEVVIDSQPAAGTCVRLRFELAQLNPNLTLESGSDATTTKVMQQRHVLLIDDDPILLRAVETVLRDAGHSVATAINGASGLATFEEHLNDSPFDVVLTDLGMPGFDGRAVALRVKAMSPTTPVIMITGWGRRMSEDGEVPAHVDRLLSKPPQRAVLLEAIESLTAAASL
jgi:signal transduction histidine kinase/ActR/RegA family two-component response regulator